MPPNGESVGLALEDATLFARVLEVHAGEPTSKLFSIYEGLRRSTIDSVYKEAELRVLYVIEARSFHHPVELKCPQTVQH
jgi:hypothetical protein